MTDEALPDRSGALLAGRYRLVKRLGAGGMGEVYRARNEAVGRDVAVKLLRPEFGANPDTVSRVTREARAANAVRHPNVVDVLDIVEDESGAPAIVQELLDGKDLAAYLASLGRPLSEAEALDLMTPVVEAVGAAHRAGLMHRDLKLENVFLHRRADGSITPKVLDFGLSRPVGENAALRMTATGVMMGTPYYMSPEQVQGHRDIDQRTDVWALGVMLYELVAGQVPFMGDTMGAIFVKVCTFDPSPLRTLAPGVSETYARVVARCLDRDRDQRPADAAALVEELRLARRNATTVVRGSGAPLPATADTLPARPPMAPPAAVQAPFASAPPPFASAPPPPDGASIAPAVSVVPAPPTRRMPRLALVGMVVTAAILGGLAWVATHRDTTPTIADLHATVPPQAPPPPSPPAIPGTTEYEPPTPPAAPAVAHAIGTTVYEPPPSPPSPAVASNGDSSSGRRGRRRRHGHDATAAAPSTATPSSHSAAPSPTPSSGRVVPGGGTDSYDKT
jgi:serine/threonine-protein kinase